ncbi:pseudouridine synthase [Aquiflexum lacus]|uniref:pseudouridine synthase n=1 Tax=Aquiflexum lacus TaxID=2483805 RepID=UPI001893883B|nr:pseudouridine synthase [Aquiflexum lacus]
MTLEKPVLEILFEDDFYIGINKPAGLLVHKTNIANDEETLFALQILRDQIGQKVYPLHRIDRPTSGVLVFAKSSEAASLLQPLFPTTEVEKFYLCIVRGYMEDKHGVINHPLKKKLIGELQEAQTSYWSLAQSKIPFSSSPKYPTSRYSLLKVYPHTGRMHQIRRHMAHARHYVIGDSTHGDNKQNNFFRVQFGLENMLLHAWKLKFTHPYSNQEINLQADLPDHFLKTLVYLNLQSDGIKPFSY